VREPTYFILVSLAGGPLHGYGMAKRAEELSDGRVRLGAGTLYGALDRMQQGGEIELDHEAMVNGRNRRYYRITNLGLRSIAAEADRMRAALAAVEDLGDFEKLAVLR